MRGEFTPNSRVSVAARSWPVARPSVRPQVARALPAIVAAVAVAVDCLLVLDAQTLPNTIGRVLPTGSAWSALPPSSLSMLLVIAIVAAGLLAVRGLYDLEHPRPLSSQLYAILSSISIALVAGQGLALVLNGPVSSSGLVLSGAFSVPAVALWHAWVGRGYAGLAVALIPPRRALIVGTNAAGRDAARALEKDGCRVLGYADDEGHADGEPGWAEERGLPHLGPIAGLIDLVERLEVDDIIIVLPAHRRAQLVRVLTRGFTRAVRVKYAPDFGELLSVRFDVRRLGDRHYIEFATVARVALAKRALDLALAVTGLVALAPVFLLVALAIKLDSAGPVFYGHVRVGKDGRHFRMLKFRSMRQDADRVLDELLALNEVAGPMFKIRSDPRITRVGRYLRRLSLDELPQLINVVNGDMSLVGPRPPLPAEVEKYQDRELGRLRALPGITGLWQVSGRTDLPFQEMVRLDLHYIRNWSFALDVTILLRTIPAVLSARGAY